MTKGKLFLIPAPLGEIDFSVIFPNFNAQIIQDIDYFIVEELRTGRRFIKKLGMKKPIESLDIQLLNEHSKPKDCDHYLQPCLKGHHVGLCLKQGRHALQIPVILLWLMLTNWVLKSFPLLALILSYSHLWAPVLTVKILLLMVIFVEIVKIVKKSSVSMNPF